MAENTIKINKIPSLTWNWLKMNEAELSVADVCQGSDEIEFKTPEGIERSLESESFADDIKGALGEVFDKKLQENVNESVLLRTKSGTSVQEPVIISTKLDAGTGFGQRVVIEADEESEITLLADISSSDEAQGRACMQTLVRAAKGSRVNLVQIDRLGSEFELLSDVGAVLDDDATLSVVHIFLGGKSIYQGCNIDLQGERASVKKDIGYFLKGDQELDMNYVVLHKGKRTECDIKASGVLEGRSSKLFRGTIDFQNGCAGSKGAEIEEVILRDDTVANKTIPVILCAEEDVEGSHGATIGRLDEDLIFYMQTRGLEEEEIYKLISKSRLLSFCSKIPDEDIRNKTMTF